MAVRCAIHSAYSQDFAYDNQDRLTSWDRNGSAGVLPADRDWTLSLVGDWDSSTIDGVSETRTHNSVHELESRTITGSGTTTLSYDAKGNLTSDGTHTYVWDFDNRMSSAANLPDSGSASYRYDALGRRVQKTVTTASNGTAITTHFHAI